MVFGKTDKSAELVYILIINITAPLSDRSEVLVNLNSRNIFRFQLQSIKNFYLQFIKSSQIRTFKNLRQKSFLFLL